MKELKLILRHAGTVLLGQLAVMAFGVADTVIAGRYSDTALAALPAAAWAAVESAGVVAVGAAVGCAPAGLVSGGAAAAAAAAICSCACATCSARESRCSVCNLWR